MRSRPTKKSQDSYDLLDDSDSSSENLIEMAQEESHQTNELAPKKDGPKEALLSFVKTRIKSKIAASANARKTDPTVRQTITEAENTHEEVIGITLEDSDPLESSPAPIYDNSVPSNTEEVVQRSVLNPVELLDLTPEQEEKLINDAVGSIRKIVIPVSICLSLVILIISSISFYTRDDGEFLIYIPFNESGNISSGVKVGQALANALVVVAIIIVATCVLLALFYFKCYKIINGWLIFTTVTIFGMFSSLFLAQLVIDRNVAFDIVTLIFLTYNVAQVGVIAIHWKAPLKLQQSYLIMVSVFMALVFIKYLPTWTTWMLLGVIAVYDIVAVLCPRGPLKMLVNLAQERNQPLFPSMIYSTMAYMDPSEDSTGDNYVTSDNVHRPNDIREVTESLISDNLDVSGARQVSFENIDRSESRPELGQSEGSEAVLTPDQNPEDTTAPANETEIESELISFDGVKLGLGDFVFYSVLVGKACTDSDWNTVFACVVAIITGLCGTLLLLCLARKALPALPISIFLGLIFYFATFYSVTPFVDYMQRTQIFL